MRKYIFILMGIMISCQSNRSLKTIDSVNAVLIDSLITRELMLLVSASNVVGYNVPIREQCYTLEFTAKCHKPEIFFSDTVAFLTYYSCDKDYSGLNYKGILVVDSINVAVFDSDNIGVKFYDTTKLINTSITEFKCFNSRSTLSSAFYIRNGGLNYWNP